MEQRCRCAVVMLYPRNSGYSSGPSGVHPARMSLRTWLFHWSVSWRGAQYWGGLPSEVP